MNQEIKRYISQCHLWICTKPIHGKPTSDWVPNLLVWQMEPYPFTKQEHRPIHQVGRNFSFTQLRGLYLSSRLEKRSSQSFWLSSSHTKRHRSPVLQRRMGSCLWSIKVYHLDYPSCQPNRAPQPRSEETSTSQAALFIELFGQSSSRVPANAVTPNRAVVLTAPNQLSPDIHFFIPVGFSTEVRKIKKRTKQ